MGLPGNDDWPSRPAGLPPFTGGLRGGGRDAGQHFAQPRARLRRGDSRHLFALLCSLPNSGAFGRSVGFFLVSDHGVSAKH